MRVHRSCFFTFLNFFRESEKLLLIFLNESVIIDKHFKTLAGVMELADVLDSKSTSPFHTTMAETLDLSRSLTTQYVNGF